MKLGFDISHYQKVLDWNAVSNYFAIFKAGEGRNEDPSFDANYANARVNAMTWGAYWFYRSDVPVTAQINAYLAALEACLYGESNLYPAIDVEPEVGLAFGPAQAADVTAFVKAIIDKFGGCMVYTSQHDWHTLGNPTIMLDPRVHLWVAHYTLNATPACPMGKEYSIWQRRVAPLVGITGDVDHDYSDALPIMRSVEEFPLGP